jgi:hypothetical protein
MKFIRKHTEGPFTVIKNDTENPYVMSGEEVIAENIYNGYDADAIGVFDKILDYLIERAGYLDAKFKTSQKYSSKAHDDDHEELTRLLEIIRAAGVEVIDVP